MACTCTQTSYFHASQTVLQKPVFWLRLKALPNKQADLFADQKKIPKQAREYEKVPKKIDLKVFRVRFDI